MTFPPSRLSRVGHLSIVPRPPSGVPDGSSPPRSGSSFIAQLSTQWVAARGAVGGASCSGYSPAVGARWNDKKKVVDKLMYFYDKLQVAISSLKMDE